MRTRGRKAVWIHKQIARDQILINMHPTLVINNHQTHEKINHTVFLFYKNKCAYACT